MVVLVSTRTATTSPICVIMKKILEFKQSGTSLPLPMASQLLMVLEELCAAKASLQRPCQDQILTTKQLFDFVSKEIRGIHFVYATLHEYEEEVKLLMERLMYSRTIPGTQSFHSFIPNSISSVEVKPYKKVPLNV